MIYKDKDEAWDDKEDLLGYRLNCNQVYASHWGWKCHNVHSQIYDSLFCKNEFNNLQEHQRFLTAEIKDSVEGPFANFPNLPENCDCQKPGCQNCIPTKRGEDL